MTENGSDSLPFEPPEQENVRLREENARLRRLLAVHSIPVPQIAPEDPPPTKPVETAPPVDIRHYEYPVYNLRGNTQITRNVRQVTKGNAPVGQAAWTLGCLYDYLSTFLFEIYEVM